MLIIYKQKITVNNIQSRDDIGRADKLPTTVRKLCFTKVITRQ